MNFPSGSILAKYKGHRIVLRKCRTALFRTACFATVFCALLSYPLNSKAREPSPGIASDRPGIGDGSWVLARGVWQAELGATLNDVGPTQAGEGSALIRAGLDDLELRLYLPSPQLFDGEGVANDLQWGDLGLGAKLPLGSNTHWDWSLITAATLPTGSASVSADALTGWGTLVGETRLGDTLGFTVNLGAEASTESSDDAVLSFIPTLTWVLGHSVSMYAGYAGFYSSGNNQHWIETGAVAASGRDFQFDINTAYDTQSGDWFVGIGLSRRWRP